MRIGVDLTPLQTGSARRGIGNFSRAMLRATALRAYRHQFVGFVHPQLGVPIDDPLEAVANGARTHWSFPGSAGVSAHDLHGEDHVDAGVAAWRTDLAAAELDCFHVTSPMEFDAFVGGDRAPCPIVGTLYDLIPLLFSDRYLAGTPAWMRRAYERALHRVAEFDHVLAISESARQDAIALLGIAPDRISVAYGGVDAEFAPLPDSDRAERLRHLSVGERFVMYTGGTDWRKNHEALVRAFGRLPATELAHTQLVIVCDLPPQTRRAIEVQAEKARCTDRLVLTGFVTRAQLVDLYNAATCFAFPSRYEGFGLPVAEAMSCGTPVVVSNRAALPEVVGDAGLLFDPDDEAALAEALAQVLADPALRSRMHADGVARARRFRWDSTAATALSAYHRVIGPIGRVQVPPLAYSVDVRGPTSLQDALRARSVVPLPPNGGALDRPRLIHLRANSDGGVFAVRPHTHDGSEPLPHPEHRMLIVPHHGAARPRSFGSGANAARRVRVVAPCVEPRQLPAQAAARLELDLSAAQFVVAITASPGEPLHTAAAEVAAQRLEAAGLDVRLLPVAPGASPSARSHAVAAADVVVWSPMEAATGAPLELLSTAGAGLPIIARGLGSLLDLPGDWCWILSPGAHEAPLLHDYLRTLVLDPPLRICMAARAARCVRENHSPEVVADEYVRLLLRAPDRPRDAG